ncbi:MAG TPA: hypothetical protein VN643_24560 [Pyrinomonadaceae bacterium]|nr:hypothetical protein [Pyrinomonadaceae bacterium]
MNQIEQPPRRPLRIFAFDPMLAQLDATRVITVSIPNEPLKPGPQGRRVEVIDYDGVNEVMYPPVDLDHPSVLMRTGLDPAEADPRFHQQMVYAVAMKVIDNFDFALGRRIDFSGKRLRLFPHAFLGRNAFFDPKMGAVLFGYFLAERSKQGANLPGQTVFTCLSHDIIAHEVTHALVHRLRPRFREPSNPDVYAFHEGFSDIVSIFQHFSFERVLQDEIQRTHTDLSNQTPLAELASQFGHATGTGRALRSANQPANGQVKNAGAGDVQEGDPQTETKDNSDYSSVLEPHDRGALLVAAVFDAFFQTYQRRIRDLVRIASGGSGRLPEGDLPPALVRRVAAEASATAQAILTMCIRAFDYLPPVDITFGDFLRALVTADYEMAPRDVFGQRALTVEAFRRRGMHPEGVTSLAEVSLLWDAPERGLPQIPDGLVRDLASAAREFGRIDREKTQSSGSGLASEDEAVRKRYARLLHAYARDNARKLHLDPKLKIELAGFHSSYRVAGDGQLLIDIIAQFEQCEKATSNDLGGAPLRGGTTIVASADGAVRYVIAKPLESGAASAAKKREAKARRKDQYAFVEACDHADAQQAWCADINDRHTRMLRMHNFASLHSRRQ